MAHRASGILDFGLSRLRIHSIADCGLGIGNAERIGHAHSVEGAEPVEFWIEKESSD
jgi:hypothetical protein